MLREVRGTSALAVRPGFAALTPVGSYGGFDPEIGDRPVARF